MRVQTPYRVVKVVKLIQSAAPTSGGGASPIYEHSQAIPSTVWNINHNLGFRPDVSVTTTGGLVFIPDIVHISNNQVQILSLVPLAGFARLT